MKTAVIYARYSSDRQHGESIDAQLRAIYLYTKNNSINVVKVYTDEAKTGTNDERPSFQLMISELKQTNPDYVLTHKMDRFARNRYDSAIYKREIQRAGARYVAVDQPIEDSPEGVILESLLEGMAEYYSKNLSKEVSSKMKEYAYKAQYLGGIVLLGFDIDKDKHYIINEEEAETVRIIYKMKLAGQGYMPTIKTLNEQGRTTKMGRPFGKNSIHEILKNEKYCGTYTYNTTPKMVNGKRNSRIKKPESEIIRIENALPAIISREDWEAVQRMLEANKYKPRQISESQYILTGVLICGRCKGAMTGHTLSKKNSKGERVSYRYYRCCKNSRGAGECDHKDRYPAQLLEEEVLQAIEQKTNKIENIEERTAELWEEIQATNSTREDDKAELKKRLASVEKKLQSYYKIIEDGVEAEYIVGPLNEAGKLKKEIEQQLEQKRSPFEGLTKKQVKQFLESQQKIVVPRDNLEKCKKIVTDHVQSVTIWDKDDRETVLKYHILGMSNAGVGEPTHSQAYRAPHLHTYKLPQQKAK